MKKHLILFLIIMIGPTWGVTHNSQQVPSIPNSQELYLPGFIDAEQDSNWAPDQIQSIITQNIEEVITLTPKMQTIDPQSIKTNSKYPDIETNGFIELKLSGRDHTNDIDKLDAVRNDEIYKKLPLDVIKGSPKLDMRYLISAKGQLDDDTSVNYDIEKEPDFPGKYNIGITKGKTKISFGDFDDTYETGSFINLKKKLNGVRIQSYTDHWEGKATIGQTKSEPQKYETFGTDNTIYKVGKQFLLEGSVVVYVNNVKKSEGIDYTINYYEGEIKFSSPKTKVDYIKIIYEFTNPIQDFIPSLSRKSFVGAQYKWRPEQSYAEKIKLTQDKVDSFTVSDNISFNPSFYASTTPIVLGSESVSLNGKKLTRLTDYYLKHQTGHLTIRNRRLSESDKLTMSYRYYQIKSSNENILGANSTGPYYLNNQNILHDHTNIYLEGLKAQEFIDYIIDYEEGKLYFNYKIPYPNQIIAKYKYIETKSSTLNIEESPMSFGITYLEESSSVKDNLLINRTNEAPGNVTGSSKETILTRFNPIDESQSLSITIDEAAIPSSQYTVNYYEGSITIPSQTNLDSKDVKLSYTYRKSFPSEFTFKGLGKQRYTLNDIIPPSLPIKYSGIRRVILYPGEIELELDRDYTVKYINNGTEFQDYELIFYKGYPSQLSQFPLESNTVKVIYDYTPDSGSTQAKTEQRMVDLTLKTNINENWNVELEYANAYHNFSKSKQDGYKLITEKPSDDIYTLDNSPVAEDSEQVFVNGISLSRGSDYFFNYEKGEFRFINKSYPSGTNIEVFYEYYLTDVPEESRSHAFKIGSNYKFSETLDISNNIKYLDPNFRSIGELKEERGTFAIYNAINWRPSPTTNISTQYEKRNKTNEQNEVLKTENDFVTIANLGIGPVDTNHQFHYYALTVTGNEAISKVDTLSTAYNNSMSFGPNNFRTKLSSTISQKLEDYHNETNKSDSFIYGYGAETYMRFKKPFIFKAIEVTPYLHQTQDNIEKVGSENDLKKITDTIGFNSKSILTNNLDTLTSFEKKTIEHTTPNDSIKDPYYNYSSLTYYRPYRWASSSYGLNHSESISPIAGQEDRVEDTESFRINHFEPYFGLKHIKIAPWVYGPLFGSKVSYQNINTERRENNALLNFVGHRQRTTFDNFEPFQGIKLNSLSLESRSSTSKDKKVLNSTIFQGSDLEGNNLKGQLEITPKGPWLTPFHYKWDFSDATSLTESNTQFNTGTQNITERVLLDETNTHVISFSPGSLNFGFIPIGNFKSSYTNKTTFKEDESTTTRFYNSTQSGDADITLDNATLGANIYHAGSSPFNLFDLDGSYTDQNEYYNRNRSTTTQGSLYKTIDDISLSTKVSPFSFLTLRATGDDNKLRQYGSNTINLSQGSLKGGSSDTILTLDENHGYLEGLFSPIQLLTLKGAFDLKDLNQRYITTTNKSQDAFRQDKLTSGLILHLFQGFDLFYDYSTKRLSQNRGAFLYGFEDKTGISYRPINYKNFNVDISFSKVKSWGYGFNEIARDELLTSSGEVLNLEINERNDYLTLGSLNINIKIPLNNFRYLEDLVISGEGYIKEIKDEINPDNELYISGMLIKTTINL